MKNRGDISAAVQSSIEYRRMYRDIVLFQINNLMEQLSHAGVESVLLTAIVKDRGDGEDFATGSQLGRRFLHEMPRYQTAFKDYCLMKNKTDIRPPLILASTPNEKLPAAATTVAAVATTEENGEEQVDFSVTKSDAPDDSNVVPDSGNVDEPPEKRPKLDTPNKQSSPETTSVVKTPGELTPSKTPGTESEYHKCSVCSYHSKFKANVSRHERSRHGLNMEGMVMPNIQYACLLCSYKSLYRSNLMRHEKNIHKIESTKMDMENRKIPYDGPSESFLSYSNELDQFKQTEHMSQTFTVTKTNQDLPGRPEPGVQLDDSSYREIVKLKDIAPKRDIQPAMDITYTVDEIKQEVVSDDWPPGMPNHVCNHCQLVFATAQELTTHHEVSLDCRGGKGPLTCEFCRANFSDISNKQLHELTCTVKQLEKCDECGKRFQYRTSLLRHQSKCKGRYSLIPQHSQKEQEVLQYSSGQGVKQGSNQHNMTQVSSQQEVIQGSSQQEMTQGSSQQEQIQGSSQHNLTQGSRQQKVTQGSSQQEMTQGASEQEQIQGSIQQDVTQASNESGVRQDIKEENQNSRQENKLMLDQKNENGSEERENGSVDCDPNTNS